MLGVTEPFLWKTVAWGMELMAESYPELVPMQGRIEDTVRHEEERFAETLETGLARINEYVGTHGGDYVATPQRVEVASPPTVDGGFLFKLYDTYGFPRDLSEEIFQDKGWRINDETAAAWDARRRLRSASRT